MKHVTRANLFAYVNFSYNVLKFAITKHTNIDVLHGKDLSGNDKSIEDENPLESFLLLCHKIHGLMFLKQKRYAYNGNIYFVIRYDARRYQQGRDDERA